ncbi:MAG: hypothetical protein KDJ90_14415 [Nitratireductor sp.]|nr:hypothetical protein [Nitratireductor sp.]
MKALFVSRHNNDYDSMAPVADGWVAASAENSAIFYFSTPELRWRDDYRTAMLRENGRIGLVDVWDIAGTGAAGDWLDSQWAGADANHRFRRKVVQMATEALVMPRYRAGLLRLLDREKPDIIAFDWYSPPARRKRFGYFGYQEILSWAKAHAVPIVSLPHGLVLYDRPQEKPSKAEAYYHTSFIQSEERRQISERNGDDLSKIFVSGSPRYDPSWVERVARRLAVKDEPESDRVNIVFFGKKQVYDFDFAAQNAWLAHLAAHPRVQLTIQPHPRGQKDKAFAALAGLSNVVIDAKTPASALIDRAQIVSTLTSSVMVEAVVRGREILYPKFVNTVLTRFEEKGACISLERMEDTHLAIDAFIAGERVPRENYEAFLKETVFGGRGPDTIARICTRMAEIAGE